MADGKDYWASTQEQGSIRISEDVVASIAALAAMDVEGVSSLSSGLGADIAELLGKKNLTRGVKIQFSDDAVTIDIFIIVKFGAIVVDVAKQVQKAVADAIEAMTALKISAIHIHVTGIGFEKDKPKEPDAS